MYLEMGFFLFFFDKTRHGETECQFKKIKFICHNSQLLTIYKNPFMLCEKTCLFNVIVLKPK